MNDRLFITIPASVFLWFLVIVVVTFAINREIVRPMTGRDAITVRLISLPAKSDIQTQKNPEIKKPDRNPIKVSKAVPKPAQSAEPAKPQWSQAKTDNTAATIIYQPMPKIPDDLRREAFSTYAMVRFHIAADGTSMVELLTPSQNPRLNHILLETLKTWRFTPATDNGRSVASTFDIRVRFAVE